MTKSSDKDAYKLHPQMRFCEAAPLAITAKLDDVFAHEEGTRAGDDIEHLHDMRVASRRLREAMTIFAPCFPKRVYKPLQKTAAALTRALGAVRDSDVMLESLARYRERIADEERIGIDDLMQVMRDERAVQRTTMIDTLDAVDRSGFQHQMKMALWGERRWERSHRADEPQQSTLGTEAQRISARRVADLYGYVPYIHDPAQADELHRMRIAAKHLRYSLEIFRSCFGPDIDDRIDDVKSIQEQIGQIHDCDVLIELLQSHLAVLAQREHEHLLNVALEPQERVERMNRLRAAIQAYQEADPRLGILALLGRKREERDKRYADFVRWWDEQEAGGLRRKLYECITAADDQHTVAGSA
jgi:CHAD domain-containing protein